MASVKSVFSTTIHQQKLINARQKILIAVSGGIDSLVLTKLLYDYRNSVDYELNLEAVHVDLPKVSLPAAHQTLLTNYLKNWHIPLTIVKGELKSGANFNCYVCAKERRKQFCLYSDQYNFDAIALGHILDDYLETGLLNLIHHGHLESLAYREAMFKGRIIIVRPLLSIAKKQLLTYAKSEQLSIPKTECAYGKNSQRAEIRQLIRKLSQLRKPFRKNLQRAIDRWNASIRN